MAGGYDGSIRIDTKIDSSGFNQGVKSVNSGITSMTSGLKKMAGAVGIAFGVAALVKFAKTAIDTASSLTEVQNVVDTAFGSMAYKAEEFASTSIEQFGMSELAAKKTASTYMAMGKSMGIAAGNASDMAIDIAGLSGDVASFYNMTQDEAATKLKGIYTGETEALKEIGVVMTEDNLKAYALAQGMTKNYSAMSQAEKVTLRYQYVMSTLGDAQGDFAKTSDSWANQTRVLSERFKELAGIIGSGLIAALTPALQMLNTMMSGLISFANTVSSVMSSLFGKTEEGAKASTAAVIDTSEATDDLTASTTAAGEAANKSTAGFDNLNVLSGGSKGAGGGSGGPTMGAAGVPADAVTPNASAVETATNAVAEAVKSMVDKIKDYYNNNLAGAVNEAWAKIKDSASGLVPVFQDVWSDIATLGAPLKDWFTGDFTTFLQTFITTCGDIVSGLLDTFAMVFSDIWNLVIFPVLTTWATDILPLITQIGTNVLSTIGVLFGEIKTLFDLLWREGVAPALALLTKIWQGAVDSIVAAWETWGTPIFDGIKQAIKSTADTLQNIWSTIIKPVWDEIMVLVDWLWTNHLKPLWDNILDFVGSLIENALVLYNNCILPLINWIVDNLGPAFSDTFNTILSVVGSVIGGIADLIGGIIKVIQGIITFLTGVFTGDWKRAWQGLVQIFTGIFEGIEGVVKGVVNVIISFINGMLNAVTRGVNTVIGALNSLSFDVPSWVPGFGGKTWGFSIPTMTAPQIPLLATGAVIPPNSEFLAVLGDQKNGVNIEAPLATLVQAFNAALDSRNFGGSSGGSGSHTWIVEGSMAALARVLNVYLDEDGQRYSVSLVEG